MTKMLFLVKTNESVNDIVRINAILRHLDLNIMYISLQDECLCSGLEVEDAKFSQETFLNNSDHSF